MEGGIRSAKTLGLEDQEKLPGGSGTCPGAGAGGTENLGEGGMVEGERSGFSVDRTMRTELFQEHELHGVHGIVGCRESGAASLEEQEQGLELHAVPGL